LSTPTATTKPQTTTTTTTTTTKSHHFIITNPKNIIAVPTSISLLKIVNAKQVSVTSHRICSPMASRSFTLNPPSKNNLVTNEKVHTPKAIMAFPKTIYDNFDDCKYITVR
jgi:hypothetical protein